MNLSSLEDAFVHELEDIYAAEKQVARALPKMAKAVDDEELRAAFEEHLVQTKQQIANIEQVFKALGRKAKGTKCEGIQGIIEEGSSLLDEDVEPEVLDAMLIASAQKVEHYEICAYGTLCTWGEQIGLENDVIQPLKQNLAQEKQTDERLTRIAESVVNRQAVEATETEEE